MLVRCSIHVLSSCPVLLSPESANNVCLVYRAGASYRVMAIEGSHFFGDKKCFILVLCLCFVLPTLESTNNVLPWSTLLPSVWCLAAAVHGSISTVHNSIRHPGVSAALGLLLHVWCPLLRSRQEWLHCCCESWPLSGPYMQSLLSRLDLLPRHGCHFSRFWFPCSLSLELLLEGLEEV